MRKQMMMGTSLVIFYNVFIFSPMGIIAESVFLIGNITGYYRHYIRKNNNRNESNKINNKCNKEIKCKNQRCDEK
jgi:hypothetical protein